jgi:UDPglucose 6-dehydrogenase
MALRVCVVGFGVVGKAQAYLLRRLGHEVFVYDPYVLPDSRLERLVDLTFICTPEASVEEALKTLISEEVQGLYVIKSTTPVGTTERLMRKYGVHICHNPEFLRQKHAYEDVINPDRVIIGQCCKKHGQVLVGLYSPLNKPIFVTTPILSELAKLAANAYLSTLITFWNEMYELTVKLNVDIRELAELVCSDHRISRYGTAKFGEPFGGKCLPKDLDYLINSFKQCNSNPILFEAVKIFNNKLSTNLVRECLSVYPFTE